MNPTNDPSMHSFIPVSGESHFPIQNLPYGVFLRRNGSQVAIGAAIGEMVLDLTLLEENQLLACPALQGRRIFGEKSLNRFMALGPEAWREVRARISKLLHADEATLRDNQPLRDRVLIPQSDVEMLLPVEIGDYTDFYSSREHATNVGTMLRGPENALMPNWLYLPVAYHGRASSVVVSGTDVRRPKGQIKPSDALKPIFGPSQSLDFELEMGVFIGPGNALGQAIAVDTAPEHLFGMVL